MTGTIPAHDILVTRLCKERLGVEDAVAARGRYAGLCAEHKRERIAREREEGAFARWGAASAAARTGGPLVEIAVLLSKNARKVERAQKRLDEACHELRKTYLEFGVAAGFLGGPR